MALLEKNILVQLYGKKVKHYKELGYDIPTHVTRDGARVKSGTEILVDIKDIPKNSHQMVKVKCDYCGKIISVRYDAYNKQREKYEIDCCSDCRVKKITHSNLDTYGVENCGQLEHVKLKIANSLSGKEVRTSQQQRHIKFLLDDYYDCILNYNCDTTYNFNLDICIPSLKIYIEYDGSGHDLQVKFDNITKEDFKTKEIQRYNMLLRNDWKMIKLISKKDKLPTDERIIKIILDAMYLLKYNNYVIYDFDNSVVKHSQTKEYCDFGELKIMR